MRFFAFLFFLIEAVFIYLFVDKFGFLNYFLEVLVSGFVGIALLFNAGFSSLNSPQAAFKRSAIPTNPDTNTSRK